MIPPLTAALDQLFGAANTPAWATNILLDSLNRGIPAQSDGILLTARLAAAPTTLSRLAATDSPVQTRAAELLAHLRWPGHEDDAATQVVPLTEGEQLLFENGRAVFMGICAGCHQPSGLGLKGLAPSLVNSKWVAADERALARIVLHGKVREGSVMPPLAALDDGSLAGALTFIRRSWGHGFDPVDPGVIARARAETVARTEPWNDKQLTQFIEEAKAARKSD